MFRNFSDIDECISGSQECDNETTECMDTEGSYIVYVVKATLVVWMYDNVKVYIEYVQYSRLKTYTCTACTVLQNVNMHIRYTYC